ncbi:aldo/keto reductase [Dactylosporangium sp. NPDC049140]|uniref:aldo/keto reductase n=1 Tax=Dactylosporangium sp. NPDC049140 TaxID=3155647 RepID=UPI0033C996A2
MNGFCDLVRNDATLLAVQRLTPIADGLGISLATLALAWVLRRGEVASAITGASRPERVHANAQASGVQLTDDVLRQIDEALGVKLTTRRPGATARRSRPLVGSQRLLETF